jgi:pimeloyl-ACP methyl ester carboxylesterase
MNVVVDGLLTNYARTGSGKVVVILPGWGDTSVGWRAFQKQLSAHYDVVVLDLPGFGGTQAPEGAWGLDEYAIFVGKFVHKLDLGVPHAVIGHSNGGAIAQRGLRAGTITADRLVLLASAGIRNQNSGRTVALRVLAKVGNLGTMLLSSNARQKLRQRLYKSVGSDLLVAEHMQPTFRKIIADDTQQDAAMIAVPTLLIYGDKDTATPPAYGQTFHKLIPSSKLEIVPGAGHFVHLEQPRAILKQIEDFLA